MDRDGRPLGRPSPDPGRRDVPAARLTLPDSSELWATTHCVDRFWERAASSETTFRAARQRLVVLTAEHAHWVDRPEWVRSDEDAALRWLALTADIVLPVYRGMARTCLTRGGLTPDEMRRHRRARRARRRRRPYPS